MLIGTDEFYHSFHGQGGRKGEFQYHDRSFYYVKLDDQNYLVRIKDDPPGRVYTFNLVEEFTGNIENDLVCIARALFGNKEILLNQEVTVSIFLFGAY